MAAEKWADRAFRVVGTWLLNNADLALRTALAKARLVELTDSVADALQEVSGRRDEHEAWNLSHGLKPNEHLALACPRCGKSHVETLTSDPSQPDYHHHVHQCTACGLRFELYVRCRSTGVEHPALVAAKVEGMAKAAEIARGTYKDGTKENAAARDVAMLVEHAMNQVKVG